MANLNNTIILENPEDNIILNSSGNDVPSASAILDSSDPLYLHPAESAHPIVVDTKLTGIDNYFEWKRQMEIVICIKRKLGMLTGVVKKPKNDPLRELLGSPTTDYLQRQFSVSNGARKFRLNKELENLEQGDKSICEYFTELRILWQNIELMNDWPPITQMTAEINAWLEAHLKEQDERKLFQFLNNLHPSYSTLRSNILMMTPLPIVEEVAAILQQEEAQRKNYKSSANMDVDNSAFYASQRNEDNIPFCNKCQQKGHPLSSCWRIVGYPVGHPMHQYFPAPQNSQNSEKPTGGQAAGASRGYRSGMQRGRSQKHPTRGNRGKMAATTMTSGGNEDMTGAITLTTAQFDQLMKNQKGKDIAYPNTEKEMEANFAGMALSTSNCLNNKSLEWIIDSGASDHMISDFELLQNCKPLITKPKINLPNGVSSVVSHCGTFQLQNGMTLHKVFYVPTFKHNLLSVQKLVKDEKCVVTFYEHMCVIQDSRTRRIKAFGREDKGIYYLLNNDSPRSPRVCGSITEFNSCKGKSYFVANSGLKDSEGILCNPCTTSDSQCNELTSFNENNGSVWHLRSDNALELVEGASKKFLLSTGIWKQTRCVDRPQQNGVVERKHRHLLEISRAIRDVKFFESMFPCKVKHFGQQMSTLQSEQMPLPRQELYAEEPVLPPSTMPEIPAAEEATLTTAVADPSVRPLRHRKAPEWTKDYECDNLVMAPATVVNVAQLHMARSFAGAATLDSFTPDPTHFHEAIQDQKWVDVMNSELQALAVNNTWVLTDLPKGRKAIGSK
ncbi:uncharacterized protein LOC141620915 [Silene latifolia]|uniref:uncharacterized protein LOC141620915 n=1 Tax=Silene latifolia TaxID=37657 RepID=UPI003D7850CA